VRRLERAPQNARYNNFAAVLQQSLGNDEAASYYYKQTVGLKPHDVMARNDHALQMARTGRFGEAQDELNRALLLQKDQPTLHKNIAAVMSRSGKMEIFAMRGRIANEYDRTNHGCSRTRKPSRSIESL
jgi:Flp pilus assembly protein TadD